MSNAYPSPGIDLRPDHWIIIRDVLRRYVPDRRVLVFGSRASWTAKEYSDLDLAILGDEPLSLSTSAALAEGFVESDLPFKVDLVDWANIDETFRDIIRRDGVNVQAPLERSSAFSLARQSVNRGWHHMPFTEAVVVNPKVRLDRGMTYPFVDMATVDAGSRCVHAVDQRAFSGSGSRFQGGDTLMARITPCLENGKVARYCTDRPSVNAHGSTEFIVIRGRLGVTDSDYAYYLTQWEEVRSYAIGQMTGTSGRQRVPVNSLDHLSVPVPPLPEQRAIASILGALDDKIQLNRRMNRTLEAMARALFKDWFVDFGPVRAKMAGRAPYLASEIWKLFPDMLDGDGKPVGWTVLPLEERIEILDSRRIPLSSRERKRRQGPYPYHGATGVMDYVDDYLFEGVHVLLGEDGSVTTPDGKPFTQYVWGQFWVNNHAHVLKGSGISNEMLLCFLRQTDVAPYVTGAVQPKLNQKNLKTIPFSSSDINTSAAFDRVVKPFFQLLRRNCEENCTLIQMRDLLLPKLMSGEICLRDAEKVVEAVA